MSRLAAIDIGTNSVKLTIADVDGAKRLRIIEERAQITRIGRGVDKTKRLSQEAIDATLAALEEFGDVVRKHGARVHACGTSAMRDAENGEEFRRLASQRIGAEVEIIDGEREAQLTFAGAMSDAHVDLIDSELVLAFDAGGGSTELIAGDESGIRRASSVNIGAVRLSERILTGDPPTGEQIAEANAFIDRELSSFDWTAIGAVIGIGGSTTTLLSMLRAEPGKSEHREKITAGELSELFDRIAPLSLERKRAFPGLDPKRADIILGGLLIIMGIVEKSALPGFTASSRGVRHGLLIEAAA